MKWSPSWLAPEVEDTVSKCWRHCQHNTCNKTTTATFTPLFHEVFQLFSPLLRLFRCFPPFWPTKWTMKALNCANRKGDSILSRGSGSQTDKSGRDCKKMIDLPKFLQKVSSWTLYYSRILLDSKRKVSNEPSVATRTVLISQQPLTLLWFCLISPRNSWQSSNSTNFELKIRTKLDKTGGKSLNNLLYRGVFAVVWWFTFYSYIIFTVYI